MRRRWRNTCYNAWRREPLQGVRKDSGRPQRGHEQRHFPATGNGDVLVENWAWGLPFATGPGFVETQSHWWPEYTPCYGTAPSFELGNRAGLNGDGGWHSQEEYRSWNTEPSHSWGAEVLSLPEHLPEQNTVSWDDELRALQQLQSSISHFESAEQFKFRTSSNCGKNKVSLKRLQNGSKPNRNNLFQKMVTAGKSIKDAIHGQVVKMKTLVTQKSKERRHNFHEVLALEGIEVGLMLEPHLVDSGELERVQKKEEENLEQDLMLWEEGWGGDFRLKTAVAEEEDIRSPYWEDVKGAVTDEAKKKLARTKFGNPVDCDPTNCLTFHGFKSRQSQAAPESFSIRNGQRLALAGAKRKSPAPSSPSFPLKVVKLLDLNKVMQSKCAEFFVLRRGPGSLKALKEKRLEVPDQLLKEFLTSLTVLKQAFSENENFLHYYSNRQGAFVSQNAAFEALGLEETVALSKAVYQPESMTAVSQ